MNMSIPKVKDISDSDLNNTVIIKLNDKNDPNNISSLS